MIEETRHSVLSRFERTRNSLERILTIIYFLRSKALYKASSLLPVVIFSTLVEILLQPRDRYWDISPVKSLNSCCSC